jgi:diacylglycerol kinase (ATP)
VGGGRYRAWQFRMMPHSLLDDGLLDVCVADAGYRPADLQAELRAGLHTRSPHVVYARGRQVVIERTDGVALCFEHDGELLPQTGSRVTLEAVPRVLPVLCDPETEDSLFDPADRLDPLDTERPNEERLRTEQPGPDKPVADKPVAEAGQW